MEARRKKSISKDIDTYLLLIALSVLFHLFPPPFEDIRFNAVGISYLLVIYSGYKFGKYWGMLTGIVSTGFWLFFTLLTDNDISTREIILGLYAKGDLYHQYPSLQGFIVYYFSVQSLAVFAAIGYLSGLICDIVEAKLLKQGVTLTELLPYEKRNYILGVGQWFERISKALFLLQLDPDDKEGTIKRRLRKIFILVVTLPLISLYIALSMTWSLHITSSVTFNIVPVLLSPVLALWLSHRFGSLIGVWLSLSLLFAPLVYLVIQEYKHEMNLPGLLSISNQGSPISIVVSLAVLAWVIGTITRRLKDQSLRDKILPQKTEHATAGRLSITHMLLLLALSIEFYYQNDHLYIKYYSTFILSTYILWLSFTRSALNVSNTVLIVLGLTSLFRTIVGTDDRIWHMVLGGISIPEVVFLSLIPFMARYIRLKSLKETRMLLLGLIVSLSLLFMIFSFYDSSVLPDIFLLIRIERLTLPLASIVLLLLLSEVMARFIWWGVAGQKSHVLPDS